MVVITQRLIEPITKNIFFPRVNITNYNVSIDGRKFYDQSINNRIKKYDEIRNDYATGCLLDYAFSKDHHQLFAIDLSKQIELDADPKPNQ